MKPLSRVVSQLVRIAVVLPALYVPVTFADAALEARARQAMANQNINQAVALYSRLVFESPDNPDYLAELSKAYQIQGDQAQAHDMVDRLLQLSADHREGMLIKGGLLMGQERWQEAAGLFERFTAHYPMDKAGYHSLSVIYQALGDKPRADTMQQKYFELP